MSDADELGCFGAGLGEGFNVMKFKQAMQLADKDHWMKAVDG